MKYITITSSNVAKYTGHNKYDTIEKVVNELLSKNGIKDVYVPKSNIEEKIVGLTEEQLAKLKVELGLPNESTPLQVENHIKSTIMKNSYSSSLTEGESKQNVDKQLADKPITNQLISQGIKQDLQMRRGNIKENKNLDKIQSTKQIKIDQRNSRMYTKELYRCDDYVIILRGKVDGHSTGDDGEGIVIESKNRTRKLFMELRDYERVQLECYMFLTGYNKALLTEHYNETENCIEYSHDSDFWQGCLNNIVEFMNTHIKPCLVE